MIKFNCEDGTDVFVQPIKEKLFNTIFIDASKNIGNFDLRFTNPPLITGFDILSVLIRTQTEKVNVGFYTQNWFSYRFAPVNAYVDSTGRNIFINRRQTKRPIKEIEETIWHELVHVSDSINTQQVYWHGDNNLKGKDQTAPVKFAKWAANWSTS